MIDEDLAGVVGREVVNCFDKICWVPAAVGVLAALLPPLLWATLRTPGGSDMRPARTAGALTLPTGAATTPCDRLVSCDMEFRGVPHRGGEVNTVATRADVAPRDGVETILPVDPPPRPAKDSGGTAAFTAAELPTGFRLS